MAGEPPRGGLMVTEKKRMVDLNLTYGDEFPDTTLRLCIGPPLPIGGTIDYGGSGAADLPGGSGGHQHEALDDQGIYVGPPPPMEAMLEHGGSGGEIVVINGGSGGSDLPGRSASYDHEIVIFNGGSGADDLQGGSGGHSHEVGSLVDTPRPVGGSFEESEESPDDRDEGRVLVDRDQAPTPAFALQFVSTDQSSLAAQSSGIGHQGQAGQRQSSSTAAADARRANMERRKAKKLQRDAEAAVRRSNVEKRRAKRQQKAAARLAAAERPESPLPEGTPRWLDPYPSQRLCVCDECFDADHVRDV